MTVKRGWVIVAFLCFVAAGIWHAVFKAWPMVLVSAGFAVLCAPVALDIS